MRSVVPEWNTHRRESDSFLQRMSVTFQLRCHPPPGAREPGGGQQGQLPPPNFYEGGGAVPLQAFTIV